MVQYYRDMFTRWTHILDPLKETSIGPKCGKIHWNYALEESYKELRYMVSAETLLK